MQGATQLSRKRLHDFRVLAVSSLMSFIDTVLLDLAQGGYLDLQCIEPVPMRGHSAAHELSHPAMLLEQHFQCGVSPSVHHGTRSGERGGVPASGATSGCTTQILAGLRSDETCVRGEPGVKDAKKHRLPARVRETPVACRGRSPVSLPPTKSKDRVFARAHRVAVVQKSRATNAVKKEEYRQRGDRGADAARLVDLEAPGITARRTSDTRQS